MGGGSSMTKMWKEKDKVNDYKWFIGINGMCKKTVEGMLWKVSWSQIVGVFIPDIDGLWNVGRVCKWGDDTLIMDFKEIQLWWWARKIGVREAN